MLGRMRIGTVVIGDGMDAGMHGAPGSAMAGTTVVSVPGVTGK